MWLMKYKEPQFGDRNLEITQLGKEGKLMTDGQAQPAKPHNEHGHILSLIHI